MDNAKVNKLLKAKGKLECAITKAVANTITAWKKENDLEVTYIDIDVEPIITMGHSIHGI